MTGETRRRAATGGRRDRATDPYSSRAGRADTDRRRVRSSGPVNFSGQRTTTAPKRTKAPKRARMPKLPGRRRGRSTGLWTALAVCLTLVALIVQTLLMAVLAVAGWGLTALVGYIEFRSDLSKVHRGEPVTKRATSARPRSSGGSRAPVRTSGPRKCSTACRRSTKPAHSRAGKLLCGCSCKGSTHGSERPGTGKPGGST